MPDTRIDPRRRYAKLLKLRKQIAERLATDRDHTSLKVKKQLKRELHLVEDEMRKEKLEVHKLNESKRAGKDEMRDLAIESFGQLLKATQVLTPRHRQIFWRIIQDKSEFQRLSALREVERMQRQYDHNSR